MKICYIFVLSVRLAVVTCASALWVLAASNFMLMLICPFGFLFNGGCKSQLVDITEPPQVVQGVWKDYID